MLYFVGYCGFDQFYLCWVCLVPILWVIDDARYSLIEIAALSWLFGTTACFVGYHWMIVLCRDIGGIPWPLAVGETVVVSVAEDCLRVRERPGLQAPEVSCLENGTVATIQSGPVEIDDHQWWQLVGYGWSASNWLRYPEERPASETATPAG